MGNHDDRGPITNEHGGPTETIREKRKKQGKNGSQLNPSQREQ
jgi:hypothetical protein